MRRTGMNRREVLRGGAALTGSAALGAAVPGYGLQGVGAAGAAGSAVGAKRSLFAVIADTHVIDEFYKPGSENGFEDNDSILHANERFRAARETINGIVLADGRRVENVFLVGDCFHNYPSTDYDFYFKNRTRLDNCREILEGFHAPVHLGFGNHDYDEPGVSRALSHRLFAAKLNGAQPYMAVDFAGIRFVHVNNFLGSTWDPKSGDFNKGAGSLGATQLAWLEAQLAARKPTIVMVHYPLFLVAPTEVADMGLHPLLRRHEETILMVLSGHWHKWVDFGRTYGPQHTVAASTRYDARAFMLFEADSHAGTVRWLDRGRPEWSTHYAAPFRVGLTTDAPAVGMRQAVSVL